MSRFLVRFDHKGAGVAYVLARKMDSGEGFSLAFDEGFRAAEAAHSADPDRVAEAFAETFDRDEARAVLHWLRGAIPECQEAHLSRYHHVHNAAPLGVFFDPSSETDAFEGAPVPVVAYVDHVYAGTLTDDDRGAA